MLWVSDYESQTSPQENPMMIKVAMLLKALASNFGNGVWRVMPMFGNRNRYFANLTTSKVPAKGSSMWGNDLVASEHAPPK